MDGMGGICSKAEHPVTRIIHISKLWFRGGYYAITLFGVVFTCEELSPTEINHERIHAAQQRELLYIPFYIWYVLEWFLLLLKYHNWTKAYFHIRFEQEAYRHQEDIGYLKRRKHYKYH